MRDQNKWAIADNGWSQHFGNADDSAIDGAPVKFQISDNLLFDIQHQDAKGFMIQVLHKRAQIGKSIGCPAYPQGGLSFWQGETPGQFAQRNQAFRLPGAQSSLLQFRDTVLAETREGIFLQE